MMQWNCELLVNGFMVKFEHFEIISEISREKMQSNNINTDTEGPRKVSILMQCLDKEG